MVESLHSLSLWLLVCIKSITVVKRQRRGQMNVNGLIKARTPHADPQQVQETQKAPGLGECYN